MAQPTRQRSRAPAKAAAKAPAKAPAKKAAAKADKAPAKTPAKQPAQSRKPQAETEQKETRATKSVKLVSRGEVVDGHVEEVALEVHDFVTSPAFVRASVTETRSLAEYESVKIEVAIQMPCYAEEVDKATADAMERAKQAVAESMDEYLGPPFDADQQEQTPAKAAAKPPAKAPAKGGKAKAKAEPEPEPEETGDDGEVIDQNDIDIGMWLYFADESQQCIGEGEVVEITEEGVVVNDGEHGDEVVAFETMNEIVYYPNQSTLPPAGAEPEEGTEGALGDSEYEGAVLLNLDDVTDGMQVIFEGANGEVLVEGRVSECGEETCLVDDINGELIEVNWNDVEVVNYFAEEE